MPYFFAELTDTFGGEANYSWVRRYKVKASTMRGALNKVSRHEGFYSFRVDYDDGETARYNAKEACVCLFLSHIGEAEEYHGKLSEI